MKKFYSCLLVVSTLFSVLCMIGCGNGSESKSDSESSLSSQSYRDAVKTLDFETARDIMNGYHDEYLECLCGDKSERKTAEGKYYSAFDYIYKAEIQYLLSELGAEECKDKILFILEEIPIEGEKLPEGLCDYYVACRDDFVDEGRTLDAYIVWTQHYNRLCDNILSLAINRKNRSLAQSILLQYVDNVEAIKGDYDGVKVNGVKIDGNHGYIKYTSEDRDAAKKKYEEAVKSGAFD